MEENTSKAYVESAGLMAGALASGTETGSPLFLINLCASMAPVQLASKTLPGLENYRLYQVTRVEDGRTRYRLRLGFFTTEAEAEEVLARVRDKYPTALTTRLSEEDQRHTRGYVVAAAAKPTMTIVPSTAHPAKAAAALPAPPVAPKATVPVAAKSSSNSPVSTPKPAPVAKATTPAASPIPAKPSPAAASPGPTPAAKEIKATAPVAPKAPSPKPTSDVITADDLLDLKNLSWDSPTGKPEQTGKHTAIPAVSGLKAQPAAKKESSVPLASNAKPATRIDTSASVRVPALELTLSDPPPPPPAKAAAPSSQPFHVGKGIELPSIGLSLQSEPVTAAKAAPPAANTKSPAVKPSTPPAPVGKAAASASANLQVATKAAPNAVTPANRASLAKSADLDSTQTIRALTTEELADEAQEKCFAIQLASSEQPVNLDAMPHLDIFEAYRLYSVAIAGSGKIVHSLRLGFFKEAVSAEAVAGYLKTFFGSPSVLRISVAEQTRFKDAILPKKSATPEAKQQPNVVELNAARSSRGTVPTVTMEVVPSAQVDTSATGSFKMNSTGSFRTSDTAKHRALPTPALKPAAKNAAPAVKRSAPLAKKTSTTGKYKMASKKSLSEQLLEEAKEVELSESGIFKVGKNESLLSRLVDKLKK